MVKKQYQRDSAEKIFETLLKRFGSGVQGYKAMMRFEKRRQREDQTIDKFRCLEGVANQMSQTEG